MLSSRKQPTKPRRRSIVVLLKVVASLLLLLVSLLPFVGIYWQHDYHVAPTAEDSVSHGVDKNNDRALQRLHEFWKNRPPGGRAHHHKQIIRRHELAVAGALDGDKHISIMEEEAETEPSKRCRGREHFWRLLHDAGVARPSQYCPPSLESIHDGSINRTDTHHREETQHSQKHKQGHHQQHLLPLWEETVAMYGSQANILRHNCPSFTTRDHDDLADDELDKSNKSNRKTWLVPQIVGLFNTGTNALKKLLLANFREMQDNFEFNSSLSFRQHQENSPDQTSSLPYRRPLHINTTAMYLNLDEKKHHPRELLYDHNNSETGHRRNRLRIIMVRDPYRWIQSTCRNRYDLEIRPVTRDKRDGKNNISTSVSTVNQHLHNNNKTTTSSHRRQRGSRVQRKPGARGCPNFDADKMEVYLYGQQYSTLAQLWTQWYQGYLSTAKTRATTNAKTNMLNNNDNHDDDTPYLVIRFEDLLFHTRDVVRSIQECSGMTLIPRAVTTSSANDDEDKNTSTIHYVLESSKDHGGNALHRHMPVSRDFVNAISLYGTQEGRTRQFQPQVLHDTNQRDLDPYLLKLFGYSVEQDIV